ncbi:hypothetical protein C8R45DRAFT_1217734 [Mycena sanguinolenta]|nr:hypothetical protein C8R45DRAFT_1217734 [Mycena sanguinolenta]
MSLPPLDTITGALLVGTWASSLLYTAEVIQFMYYFRHFKNDDWRLKSLVAVAFTVDTVSWLGDCAAVYLYTITHAGDLAYLSKGNWAFPLYIMTTCIVAILAQSFLIARYWLFTRNTLLVVVMGVLAFSSFGGGFASGVILALFPGLEARSKVRATAPVWVSTQLSADFLIASALIWEFHKVTSTFIVSQRRITNALNRVIILTVQTGSATSVVALAALVTYRVQPDSNVDIGIMYNLGRVYMLSMLLNLNIRTSGRSGTSRGGSSRTPTGAPSSIVLAGLDTTVEDLGGIHVHRTAVVQIKDKPSNADFKSSSHLEGQMNYPRETYRRGSGKSFSDSSRPEAIKMSDNLKYAPQKESESLC